MKCKECQGKQNKECPYKFCFILCEECGKLFSAKAEAPRVIVEGKQRHYKHICQNCYGEIMNEE